MLLGIMAGSGIIAGSELKVVLGTMFSCSLALGISSGVSVYEAETLERERRVAELEESMLTDLEDTEISRSVRTAAFVISLINFLTPLFMCAVSVSPFLLSSLGLLEIKAAAWISATMALATLLLAGTYIARNGKGNAVLKGMRMAAFGGAAFLVGRWIQTLI